MKAGKKHKVSVLLSLLLILLMRSTVIADAKNSAVELVDKALIEKTFYEYNAAYEEVIKLTDEREKNQLLNKLASIANAVYSIDIKMINAKMSELVETKSGKTYDEIQSTINKANIAEVDKKYLLQEVTSWGKKLVWTDDYSNAVNNLVIAWSKKDIDSVNLAEKYIEKVNNQYSRQYLKEELTNLKSSLNNFNNGTNQNTVEEVAKNVNCVVYIEVKNSNDEVIATGSGFIVSPEGKVITNYHVIDGAYSANVILQDGKKYDIDGIMGYDKEKDIAILKLKNADNLPIVTLGDSDKFALGSQVVAIGSPLGYQNTISTGIISGLNRKSQIREGEDIQFTAAIASGSSGGALFNMKSEVIGITYAGYSESGDLGFAIPINEVKDYINVTSVKSLSEVNGITAEQNININDLYSFYRFIGNDRAEVAKKLVAILGDTYSVEITQEDNKKAELTVTKLIDEDFYYYFLFSIEYDKEYGDLKITTTNLCGLENSADFIKELLNLYPTNKDVILNDIKRELLNVGSILNSNKDTIEQDILTESDTIYYSKIESTDYGVSGQKVQTSNGIFLDMFSIIYADEQ